LRRRDLGPSGKGEKSEPAIEQVMEELSAERPSATDERDESTMAEAKTEEAIHATQKSER